MIDLSVLESDTVNGRCPVGQEALGKYGETVLADCGITDADVNIVFIGDYEMSDLNERFKGRSGTTDVLSFQLSGDHELMLTGEVYVSLPRAEIQAGEYGVTFPEETVRLVTHGLLHLAGHVHDTDEMLDAMTRDTERFLAQWRDGEEPLQ